MADVLYAQTAAPSAGPAAGTPMAMIINYLPIIAVVGLFYFLMIRPQSTERKKKEEQLRGIERGDKVLTRGGHYGIVHDIKDHVLTVKLNENTKVEMHRDYVDSVEKNK
jgi:preprotein translocase subunit YajC